MRRLAIGILLALLCFSTLSCKDGSGSSEDAGMGGALDGGSGGTSGAGGSGGMSGASGSGGMGGVGGAICEDTLCGMDCVDLNTNNQHCGTCDKACGELMICSGGICFPEP